MYVGDAVITSRSSLETIPENVDEEDGEMTALSMANSSNYVSHSLMEEDIFHSGRWVGEGDDLVELDGVRGQKDDTGGPSTQSPALLSNMNSGKSSHRLSNKSSITDYFKLLPRRQMSVGMDSEDEVWRMALQEHPGV